MCVTQAMLDLDARRPRRKLVLASSCPRLATPASPASTPSGSSGRARRWTAASVAVILAALGACRAAGARSPERALSAEAVVIAMPAPPEDELAEVGLRAISLLCAYHGVEFPPAEREGLARIARERKGVSGTELRERLEALGFETYVFRGTCDDAATSVVRHVDARRPIVVAVAGDTGNVYGLLIGYDPSPNGVGFVLVEPSGSRVVLSAEAFEHRWESTRRFTLLAVPAAGAGPSMAADHPVEEP